MDFQDLAAKTERFTGADLKALLYNAQLEAIHTNLGSGLTQVDKTDTKEVPPLFILTLICLKVLILSMFFLAKLCLIRFSFPIFIYRGLKS